MFMFRVPFYCVLCWGGGGLRATAHGVMGSVHLGWRTQFGGGGGARTGVNHKVQEERKGNILSFASLLKFCGDKPP